MFLLAIIRQKISIVNLEDLIQLFILLFMKSDELTQTAFVTDIENYLKEVINIEQTLTSESSKFYFKFMFAEITFMRRFIDFKISALKQNETVEFDDFSSQARPNFKEEILTQSKNVADSTESHGDYLVFSDFGHYVKFTSFVSKLYFRILQISPVSIDNGINKTKGMLESLFFLSSLAEPHLLHYLVSAMSTIFSLKQEDKLLA